MARSRAAGRVDDVVLREICASCLHKLLAQAAGGAEWVPAEYRRGEVYQSGVEPRRRGWAMLFWGRLFWRGVGSPAPPSRKRQRSRCRHLALRRLGGGGMGGVGTGGGRRWDGVAFEVAIGEVARIRVVRSPRRIITASPLGVAALLAGAGDDVILRGRLRWK